LKTFELVTQLKDAAGGSNSYHFCITLPYRLEKLVIHFFCLFFVYFSLWTLKNTIDHIHIYTVREVYIYVHVYGCWALFMVNIQNQQTKNSYIYVYVYIYCVYADLFLQTTYTDILIALQSPRKPNILCPPCSCSLTIP